jgi:Phosphatidylglycerophosphate synthase
MNIPNMLSVFRLCLVPAFVILYFSGLVHAKYYAALTYFLASFTDFLDGYIARRFNLITNLGRVLDPLGDKMFTLAALSCLAIDEIIPLWALCLFFTKEMLMGIGGLWVHKRLQKEMPSANMLGKTATVLFFVVCVILLVVDVPKNVSIPLISAALSVSMMALVSYLISFFKLINEGSG